MRLSTIGNEFASLALQLEPSLTVRVLAGLFCIIIGALILALVLEADRHRVRIDPHAEPYGDGHGFTTEQLAEFRGHLTPSSVDPLRRSFSQPVFGASDGVALRPDASVGGSSIPSIGTADARNPSRRS